MKIKRDSEIYQRVRTAMKEAVEKHGANRWLAAYKKHTVKRMLWDIYWKCSQTKRISINESNEFNILDTHIETMLFAIGRDIELLLPPNGRACVMHEMRKAGKIS